MSKISENLIVNIISKLHNGKSDSSNNWGTDALKAGVNVLANPFCNLFKAFFTHGYISDLFLNCSLMPIVKNQNSSKVKSDNYRLIAISSLFLKILDYIILTLFSETFQSINLQFGFQKNCSQTMCTWTLLETINYFTNRGSSMFICLLDLSKAFDTIKHDILFRKLSEKIPPLFLRVVIYSYLFQKCTVKWGNAVSNQFSVSNGVRQGAVASPTFFNIYLDDLFNIFKSSGLGCMIDNFYYGFLGYADDCALLSPSRETLQNMLIICEKYFDEHGIKISTNVVLDKSKTKCMAINIPCEPAKILYADDCALLNPTRETVQNHLNICNEVFQEQGITISTNFKLKRNIKKWNPLEIPGEPIKILLYDTPLPWVESYKHLGHMIHSDEDMSHDLFQKRAEFISKLHALRQELGNQDPNVFMSLVFIYLSSMYGSNLWDLYSTAADKLYISWNVLIKNTYDLPYATHRYILQEMFYQPHIRISLLKRFIKFYNNLKLSNKPQVRHLFQLQKSDFRSTFGGNCRHLCEEMNVNKIEDVVVSNISMPIKVNAQDAWRVPFLKELLSLRKGTYEADLTNTEISDLINHICCD